MKSKTESFSGKRIVGLQVMLSHSKLGLRIRWNSQLIKLNSLEADSALE